MPLFQAVAFFDNYPTLDPAALRDAILSCDPEGKNLPCAATAVEERTELPEELVPLKAAHPEFRMAEGALRLGDMEMQLRLHNTPAPHADCIRASLLSPEEKQRLQRHKAFGLLTLADTGASPAIERLIFLLKAGLALTHQGAIGIGNEINMTAFTREILDETLKDWTDQGDSLWRSLRQEGIPVELLVNFFLTNLHGENWCFSAGHELFGFPDFACRVERPSDLEDIQNAFYNGFLVMFESGEPIESGEVFGGEEGEEGAPQFRFDAPTLDQEYLLQDNGILVITRVGEEG